MKDCNILFIECESPAKLVIAIPIGDINYHEPYYLAQVEYSRDVLLEISESRFFIQRPVSALPESITDMFDYKRHYADRAVRFYSSIPQTKL